MLFETRFFLLNHYLDFFQTFLTATSCCTSQVLIEKNSSKWQRGFSSRFILKLRHLLIYLVTWFNSANSRNNECRKNATRNPTRTQDTLRNQKPLRTYDPMRTQYPMMTQDPKKTHDHIRIQDPKRTQDLMRGQDPMRTQQLVRMQDPERIKDPESLEDVNVWWIQILI